MSPSADFAAWMTAIQNRTEQALDHWLPGSEIAPQRLHQAMRYVSLGGGKRIRPLLCHAAGNISGAVATRLDAAACAVELIHAYSLVHDDLPSMDDDILRRGKPTCHIEYDEPTALLAGDALQSLAFQVIAQQTLANDAHNQLAMVALLAQAAGSRGMAGGQAIDLAAVGKQLSVEELEFMHIHKTGALIRAAVLLGAHCAERITPSQIEQLDHYAKIAGLLFQVVDDLLDSDAATATLGKTAGKDAQQNKATYVTVLGAARAREFAADLRTQAKEALLPFGDEAQRLRELTDFIVARKF